MLLKNIYIVVQSAEQKEESDYEVPMEHYRILDHIGPNFAIGKQKQLQLDLRSQISSNQVTST